MSFRNLLRKVRRTTRRAILGRNTHEEIERFFRQIKPLSVADSGRRVLQYVGIPAMFLTPVEILMYHLFRQCGAEVDYFIYDENCEINEIITQQREQEIGKDPFWSSVLRSGRKLLRAGNVEFRTIPRSSRAVEIVSELEGLDAILSFHFDGVDFGSIVKGSLYRYLKSKQLRSGSESVARRMLITSLSNYLHFDSLVGETKYDLVAFSHGIYLTWQPIVESCRKHGIDFICYDRAKTRGCLNFNVNQPSPDWSFNASWERYRNRELSVDENKRVEDYLNERVLQKGDVYSYNFSEKSDVATEKERLSIQVDKKCVTIFTNLIWDAANVCREIAFESTLQCILNTAEFFRGREDVQVIVRSHPAEKVLGTETRYCDLVRQHFGPSIPDNLTLIEPEDDINSFTIIDMTDVAVVNTSTVGIELVIKSVPTVLIAETHYRGRGFTLDVSSPEEYFRTLERCLTSGIVSDGQLKLARKYFFMMMFLYQKQVPVRYGEDSTFKSYAYDFFEDIPESDELKKIVKLCMNGSPDDFVEWN